MNSLEKNALRLITEFKGEHYRFGMNVLSQASELAKSFGQRAVLVRSSFPGSDSFVDRLLMALTEHEIRCEAVITGPAPNAPIEDLLRITEGIHAVAPDFLISFGGGSVIDTVKAAIVLHTLGGEIETYFGTGKVTEELRKTEKSLPPHLAIQTAASSAAHLTKYSNITNLKTGQKKLIVDDAIIPAKAIFDICTTLNAPLSLTIDGALDGISHALEVLYGAVGKPNYSHIEEVSLTAIELIVTALPVVMDASSNEKARTRLALGTDLGGAAIMLGGTNGGHLTSFSLVNLLPHGRACGLMNPYYSVYFAPAIQEPLRKVGQIYQRAGFSAADFNALDGYALGVAVAQAMFAFNRQAGLPVSLNAVEGFSRETIQLALDAAQNPQLKMKLENMPMPMLPAMVNEHMRSVLEAAVTGDLSRILRSN